VVELEDGSALKLTVARYFTPLHRSIQERGIAPDVPVGEGADGEGAETPAPPMGPAGGSSRGDPPLDRAVDLLKAAKVFRGGPPGTP
jgi:carboxyl-terminal processing protease